MWGPQGGQFKENGAKKDNAVVLSPEGAGGSQQTALRAWSRPFSRVLIHYVPIHVGVQLGISEGRASGLRALRDLSKGLK